MDDTLSQLLSIPSSPTSDGYRRVVVRADRSSATVICRRCSAPFEVNTINLRHAIRAGTPRFQFCGRSCARSWWHAHNPEVSKATITKLIATAPTTPPVYVRTPEIRAKLSQALRTIGHRPRERGGNGTTAPCEALVASAMPEWTPQHVVPLGRRQPGYPTHYKLDFAVIDKMLDIELDGPSHAAVSRQESDRRRDSRLAALGWRVLRIKNTEILSRSSTSQLRVYLTSLLQTC